MSIIVTPTTYPTDLMERLMFNPDLFPEHISFVIQRNKQMQLVLAQ